MPFQPGQKPPPGSGRPKGALNKLTRTAIQRLAELDCDPLEGMAKIAADKKAPIELRARMYAELAQYAYPKRKAIEHSGVDGGTIQVNVSGTELIARRLASIAARINPPGDSQRPI